MRLTWKWTRSDGQVSAKDLLRSERGSSLVEFALCLPIFLVLLAGIADYGQMIQASMLVTQAAAAGAAYGAIPGNQNNLAGMRTAAQNSASGLASFSVVAADVYSCTPGGATVSSSASCSGYGTPIKYVQVKTTATVHPMLPISGLGASTTLNGSSMYRVVWTP